MTSYDPFAFGQVSLDGTPGPGQASPDDLLFAEAGPVRQAAPAGAGWGAKAPGAARGHAGTQDATSIEQFGVDILGEDAAAATPKLEAPAVAKHPTAAPSPRPAADAVARVRSPNAAHSARPSPLAASSAAPAATAETVRMAASAKAAARPHTAVPALAGHRSPVLGILVPVVVVAAGGMAVSWCWFIQGNPVMAGILGALALVGAALARVAIRS